MTLKKFKKQLRRLSKLMVTKYMWNSEDVVKATGGRATKSFKATGISMDSRTVQPGEIFIAISGKVFNGHNFVEKALEDGAAAAIVKEGFELETDRPLVYVKDIDKALEDLGRYSRNRTKAKIIAVTGSAGKTGTKELLSIALGASGKAYASKKSFNNAIGVPFSLANMPLDTEYGIFEIGMNHKGEIEKLVADVRPHLAIITTVEPVHIEFFENEEGIADAKAEIFSAIEGDAIAVLNLDNPHFQRLKEKAIAQGVKTIYSFGEDEDADCRMKDCSLGGDYVKVTANVMGYNAKYRVNIPGKHIAQNSLSVLTTVKALGADLDKAIKALKKSEPVVGRGSRTKIKIKKGEPDILVIDESYNANPSSMRAAFNVFEMVEPEKGGRRIAVLGDMLELGKDGVQMHIDLANPLLKAKTDLVFCCGPLMEAMFNVLPDAWHGGWSNNSQDLAKMLAKEVKPGDVILVKGSAGSKMSYVIQALQEMNKKG